MGVYNGVWLAYTSVRLDNLGIMGLVVDMWYCIASLVEVHLDGVFG